MINIIKSASLIIQGLCRFIYENLSLYYQFVSSLGGFLLIEHSYDYPLDLDLCLGCKMLGGFLLIEHSYDYPTDLAYTYGMKYYLGATC